MSNRSIVMLNKTLEQMKEYNYIKVTFSTNFDHEEESRRRIDKTRVLSASTQMMISMLLLSQ